MDGFQQLLNKISVSQKQMGININIGKSEAVHDIQS